MNQTFWTNNRRKSCKCGTCRGLTRENIVVWDKILRYKPAVVRALKGLFQ